MTLITKCADLCPNESHRCPTSEAVDGFKVVVILHTERWVGERDHRNKQGKDDVGNHQGGNAGLNDSAYSVCGETLYEAHG